MEIIKTLEELNSKKVNGGGVIPYTKNENEYLFLFGRESIERKWEDSGKWGDFGGKFNDDETNLDGIIREFYEESHGFFGNKEYLNKYFTKNISNLLILFSKEYDGIIIFLPINYNPDLPNFFKNSIFITKDILVRKGAIKMAQNRGFFEKDDVSFFSIKEIIEKQKKFRKNINEILKYLIEHWEVN